MLQSIAKNWQLERDRILPGKNICNGFFVYGYRHSGDAIIGAGLHSSAAHHLNTDPRCRFIKYRGHFRTPSNDNLERRFGFTTIVHTQLKFVATYTTGFSLEVQRFGIQHASSASY